ncbi:hypothetical protein CL634_00480 [bacterium]|nr:hypothetical protein [bacterium]
MPKKEEKAKETRKEEKKNLESLSQTHGKDEEAPVVPTTLDQIWGDDGTWKYPTMDAGEYKDELDAMAKSDLQNHAIKIGIIPIDNRAMLTQRLVREFKNHTSQYKATSVPLQEKEDGEVASEIKQILEEGR